MFKQALSIILVFLLACLVPLGIAGCGGSPTESDPSDKESSMEVTTDEGPTIRKDEEGLVSVWINNGVAEVHLDLEKWEELHKLSEIDPDYFDVELLSEGPFTVEFLSGRVKDACIGKIEDLDDMGYENFIAPVVVLLMEDGTLEYFPVDPYPYEETLVFYSYGVLPWLNNIVSLAYEQETEGKGEMTIFATDQDGLRYDVRLPAKLTTMFDAEWAHFLVEDEMDQGIFLTFEDDKTVTFEEGAFDGERSEKKTGSYTVYLAENDPSNQRPGTLVLDFSGETGTYQMSSDGFVLLLDLMDGTSLLLDESGKPVVIFEFYQPAMHMGWDDMMFDEDDEGDWDMEWDEDEGEDGGEDEGEE